jgi:hypothetical protein
MTTFYCLRFETPQPGGPGPRIYIPQEQCGPVYPKALDYLFVAFYDSQGNGGGVRPSLHTGKLSVCLSVCLSVRPSVRPSACLSIYVSDSESELLYDWQFTANQFVLATNLLRVTTRIFFQLNTCNCSPYIISSLTRGWVSCLQLLLGLTSSVILRSESSGTLIRDSLEGQGGPVIAPGTGFYFRRLLRLAGLRWRYSNPPPHGV